MTDFTPAQARELANEYCPNEGVAVALRSLADQLEQANLQHEALKQQAQTWKMEAQTQAATVHEIYQLCTGGTGEPGDWNGAEPVRKLVAELAALRAAAPVLPAPVARDGVHSDQVALLLSKVRVAACVIENLPELPGYNGSILTIDDTEAARISKELYEIAEFLDKPQAAPVAQLSEPPDPFTDDEMVCAAWALLGAAKGTKQAKAFNVGARWARSHLTSASTIPKE